MAARLSLSPSRYALNQNSEINVTPFVDVMLVLLIIFMVAAPLATVSLDLELPPPQASAITLPPPVVTIAGGGAVSLSIGDWTGESSLETLPGDLEARLGAHATESLIVVRGVQGVRYRELMAVMNRLSRSGFTKVGLMSEAVAAPQG